MALEVRAKPVPETPTQRQRDIHELTLPPPVLGVQHACLDKLLMILIGDGKTQEILDVASFDHCDISAEVGMFNNKFQNVSESQEQLSIGWTEQKCKEWDELAQEDHTYRLTPEEKEKIQRTMVSYSEQSRQIWAYEATI